MSIKVSSKGLIKLRILKSNNTDVSSMKKYENKISFNVTDGYIVDTYTCTSGDYSYDNINDILTISNVDDNTICTVNYKEGYKKLYDIIMGQPLVLNNGLRETTSTSSGVSVFYYRGEVENNYVRLPEKRGETITNALYRIVRTNEDESIRLIRQNFITYNAHKNNAYYFNANNHTQYKYMYYSESNVDGGVMKAVNDWYAYAIEGTTLKEKVVDSTFCEQAKVKYSTSYTSGSATMEIASKDYKPSLKCDLDGNEKGPLTMKAGLIMADEAVMAGIPLYYDGISSSEYNTKSYIASLYGWTMSPAGFDGNYAHAWYMTASAYIGNRYLQNYFNVHPVISISKDSIVKSGNGTSSSPYVVE